MCILIIVMLFVVITAADGAIIISDFAADTSGWVAGENVSSVERVDFTWQQDGEEYSRSCLEVFSKSATSDTLRSVVTLFDSPLNLMEYREISFDIYVPPIDGDEEALFLVRLTLIGENGDSTEHLEMIEAGKWNNINARIITWDGRDAIVGAEIAVAVDTVLSSYPADSFYLDDVVTSKRIDKELTARFLFDEYFVQGGTGTLSDDKDMIVLVHGDNTAMSLDAQTSIPESINEANQLRIRLANRTANTFFTLYYSTSDSQATTEDKSVEIPMLPNSDFTDYYVDVGDVSQLHKIRLTFEASVGQVELASISVIPKHNVYDYNTCGKFISCRLSPDASSITFSGEVNRDVASANQSGYIGIYEYTGDEPPTKEKLADMTPLVKTSMATRYGVSWQIPKNSLYMASSSFIAVVVGEDGSYRFISPPFHVENLEVLASGKFTMNVDAKGYSANDISAVGDSDAEITLVEIDINKAFSQSAQPQMYLYRGSTYYLNSEYIDMLSERMTILKKAGTQILLRLYWQDSVYGTQTAAIGLDNQFVGVDRVGALSSYIAKNWVADGTVVGVVYGNGENCLDAGETFTDNIKITAKNLRSVYMNLIAVNSAAKVYISLTDKYSAEVQNGLSEIGLKEYIPALTAQTAVYTQFPWEIAVECDAHSEKESVGGTFISVPNCDELRTLLADCGLPGKHMIFIDSAYAAPDANKSALICDYVVGTYTSKFADDIDAYVAVAGEYSNRISEAVRYVYTSEAYIVENIAKKTLDVDDMAQAVFGYDAKKLETQTLTQTEASADMPDGIKGKFTYYRFDSIAGIGDFYPSYYSSDFRIVNDNGNVMSAELDASDATAEWMGVANVLRAKEDLRLTPVLAITLKVDSVSPDTVSQVPVKVVLKSDTERFESLGAVSVGEWTTLYIDTDGFVGAKDTSKIEILAGNSKVSSAVIKLHSIDGLSREYNDESLIQVIEKARLDRDSTVAKIDFGIYLPIGIAVVVVVCTVIALILLSRKKNSKE